MTPADRLVSYLTFRLGCPERAGDALQSAMLRAVKNRRRFAMVDNPVAYMFQIARNEAFRLTRAETTRNPKARPVAEPHEREFNHEPRLDMAELASEALNRLSHAEREIVELKLFGGLPFREIAMVTEQPQGTVATVYRRALESLRPWLERQLEGNSRRGVK